DAIGLLERGVRRRPRAFTVHLLAEVLRLSDSERAAFREAATVARADTAVPGREWHATDPQRIVHMLDLLSDEVERHRSDLREPERAINTARFLRDEITRQRPDPILVRQ